MKVLQFSGGLDSLACLLLLHKVPSLTVVSVLTDGAYATTPVYLGHVQAAFPELHFISIHTKRQIEKFGHPVDIVPLRWTVLGQAARDSHDVRYQDAYSCCHRAIWAPLDRACRGLGAKVIYRGQRDDDRLRDPLPNGAIVDGVMMLYPIAKWTRSQVVEYVMEKAPDLMPPGYGDGELTSRDCIDCTAYLQDNQQRISNLPARERKRVNDLLGRWRDDVLTEMETMK
jgi:phosphoadenosine phosphosulfate reductase